MLKRFVLTFLLFAPTVSFSGEFTDKSKVFVENLGKEVVEKVSDINISDNQNNYSVKNMGQLSYVSTQTLLSLRFELINNFIEKTIVHKTPL